MGKLTESIAVRYSTVRRTAGTVRLVDDETLCFVAGVEKIFPQSAESERTVYKLITAQLVDSFFRRECFILSKFFFQGSMRYVGILSIICIKERVKFGDKLN